MLKTNLFRGPFMSTLLFLGILFQNCTEARSQDKRDKDEYDDFSMLEYNNPGLSVDLGVGIMGMAPTDGF